MDDTAEGLTHPCTHTNTLTHMVMFLSAEVCASGHCYTAKLKCVSGAESKNDPSFTSDAAVSPSEW